MMITVQGYPVIDENVTATLGTGYEGRDYSAYPIGGLKCARPAAKATIPDDIADRIAQKTREKSWVTDICDACGVIRKNQENSNYCWIHAPVHAMECYYALSGGLLVPLSAFKAGADIKGGRNQGGSGIVGVEYLADKGTCTEALHPSMDFSTRISAEQVENSSLHKITEYEEFDPDDHASIIVSVLNNIPVTVGIPAWSHEILITALVYDKQQFSFNNGIGYVFDNSWGMDWGNNGRGILSRTYSRFDEAGSIRACTPATH